MNNYDAFKDLIWEKGRKLYRDMPWRDNTDPYYVMVSEIMLQQTQVERVIPKFNTFIEQFPTIEDLANAKLEAVLRQWNGLGYNRRAKFLHEAAKMVVNAYNGEFPQTIEGLCTLPGVGPNTAGAIAAYSLNIPAVFIETNVRTVYFYHFFAHEETVSDAELRKFVAETIDTEHPREWYWALMDYGSFLKRSGVRLNSKSKHHVKQSPLAGSLREMRGMIIRELTSNGPQLLSTLEHTYGADSRFLPALDDLQAEKLVHLRGATLALGSAE